MVGCPLWENGLFIMICLRTKVSSVTGMSFFNGYFAAFHSVLHKYTFVETMRVV